MFVAGSKTPKGCDPIDSANKQARILVVLGTRPEAVKLAPVVTQLRAHGASVELGLTGQHASVVHRILKQFDLRADWDLRIMKRGQSLDGVVSRAILGLGLALDRSAPMAVVVQGDTSSAFAGALAAYHRGIPVAHVEAGLRTYQSHSPFPEEFNRRSIGLIARWHFAPTQGAAAHILQERLFGDVYVTGNTGVDALHALSAAQLIVPTVFRSFVSNSRYMIATAHRRESWGVGIDGITRALRDVLQHEQDLRLIFITHPNNAVSEPVRQMFADTPRALVTDAVDYPDFIALLSKAVVAVSDSGGVQEEGPTLGIPVVVTRNHTERPEAVQAGAAILAGTDRARVCDMTLAIVRDEALRARMSDVGREVFGDGHAAERIATIIVDDLSKCESLNPSLAILRRLPA